jgi:hypothetical protein
MQYRGTSHACITERGHEQGDEELPAIAPSLPALLVVDIATAASAPASVNFTGELL